MTQSPTLAREVGGLAQKLWACPQDIPSHMLRSWRLLQSQRRLSRQSDLNAQQAGYLAHFGVHLTGDNAGDVVLYDAVQQILSPLVESARFRSLPLRQPVTPELVDSLNRDARCIILGGGGLFFPVDSGKSASGWQWNIDRKLLEKIRIPLIIYAVGVNNFRGQEGFLQSTAQHLEATCRTAAFIGLRNHGSLKKLQALVPGVDAAKLFWQPCPTTVLSYLTNIPIRRTPSKLTIGVNVAVDKAEMRFANRIDNIMEAIAEACQRLQASGHRIVVVTHAVSDEYILPFLQRLRLPFSVQRLERCLPEQVVHFYSQVDLTMGMRGHAQMIPFGCGNAILSIKSHDKLGYFLEDIGHSEWGIEVLHPNLADQIWQTAQAIAMDLDGVKQQIAEAREKLWKVCQENLARIQSKLQSP